MPDTEEDAPLQCARCVKQLKRGRSEFFIVEIHTQADPTAPTLDDTDMQRDYESEINRLVAELEDYMPPSQCVTIHLCLECYSDWIARPAG